MVRPLNYKGLLSFQSNFEEMSKHPSSINRRGPKKQKNLVMFLVGCFCFGRCVPFHIQAGRVLGIKCQLSSDDLSCKRNKEYIQTSSPLCSMIFFISLFVPHHACEDEIKKMKLLNCHFRGLHNVLPIVQKQREAEKIYTPNLFYKGLTS